MPRPANALIVDDEPHILVLLRGILKQLGVETVWETANGSQALELAAEHKPEVVLLDLNLPDVDGLQVLSRIKAGHPTIPVIIVSAQSTMRSFARALELGAEGYVLKHAPKSEVIQTLSDLFDAIAKKSAGDAAGEKPPAPP